MSKPRTVYIGVQTYGLLDLRGKTPVCIDPARAVAFLREFPEPDARRVDGDACVAGDWYAVHEGMVDGPYKTKVAAEKNRRKNFGDCTITDDPGRLWRVHKAHRVSGAGRVMHAILKTKVW